MSVHYRARFKPIVLKAYALTLYLYERDPDIVPNAHHISLTRVDKEMFIMLPFLPDYKSIEKKYTETLRNFKKNHGYLLSDNQ